MNKIGVSGSNHTSGKLWLTAWAESFIFAGGSALFLRALAYFPGHWYFSFFALAPFLYRTIKAPSTECLRLGFLLGLSFFGASMIDSGVSSPFISVFKLFCGIALFALFGWAIGWARQRWRFDPALIALSWFGLVLGLLKLDWAQLLFTESGLSLSLFHELTGLLSLLAGSTIIALLSTLLVLVTNKILELLKNQRKIACQQKRRWNPFGVCGPLHEKVYFIPEERAPPILKNLM